MFFNFDELGIAFTVITGGFSLLFMVMAFVYVNTGRRKKNAGTVILRILLYLMLILDVLLILTYALNYFEIISTEQIYDFLTLSFAGRPFTFDSAIVTSVLGLLDVWFGKDLVAVLFITGVVCLILSYVKRFKEKKIKAAAEAGAAVAAVAEAAENETEADNSAEADDEDDIIVDAEPLTEEEIADVDNIVEEQLEKESAVAEEELVAEEEQTTEDETAIKEESAVVNEPTFEEATEAIGESEAEEPVAEEEPASEDEPETVEEPVAEEELESIEEPVSEEEPESAGEPAIEEKPAVQEQAVEEEPEVVAEQTSDEEPEATEQPVAEEEPSAAGEEPEAAENPAQENFVFEEDKPESSECEPSFGQDNYDVETTGNADEVQPVKETEVKPDIDRTSDFPMRNPEEKIRVASSIQYVDSRRRPEIKKRPAPVSEKPENVNTKPVEEKKEPLVKRERSSSVPPSSSETGSANIPVTRRMVVLNKLNVVNMFNDYLNQKSQEEKDMFTSSINHIKFK